MHHRECHVIDYYFLNSNNNFNLSLTRDILQLFIRSFLFYFIFPFLLSFSFFCFFSCSLIYHHINCNNILFLFDTTQCEKYLFLLFFVFSSTLQFIHRHSMSFCHTMDQSCLVVQLQSKQTCILRMVTDHQALLDIYGPMMLSYLMKK